MIHLITILKAALHLFILQTQAFFNKTETADVNSLPARWALVPVNNNNGLIKNK